MNCDTCKERQKQAQPIPYIAHEAAIARMERTNKRLWIVVIILIAALLATNLAWTLYESQFETVVTTEIEQDTGDGNGNNYIVGGDYHGTTEGADDAVTTEENGR